MKLGRFIVRGSLTLLIVSACQSPAMLRDDVITKVVKAALVEDRQMNLVRVDVDTEDGIVYLSGDVDAFEHKLRAEQLTRNIEGVEDVVNKLKVHD
jgi:hyperosmotically inducible periplasmic protein